MRLRFPLIPIAVHIRVEYLPEAWIRPRFSIRALALIVAFVACLLGSYMTMVEMPARRQRFLRADRIITEQVDLLEGAAGEAMTQDREAKELYERDLKSLEQEEGKASGSPEGSEERDQHLYAASLWRAEAARVKKRQGFGDRISAALRARAGELRDLRGLASENLSALELLASNSGKYPDTSEWHDLKLAGRLKDLLARMALRSRYP